MLGVVPSTDPARPPTETALTERVLRWLDMLGLDPSRGSAPAGLTPACGLAGASHAWARQALPSLRKSPPTSTTPGACGVHRASRPSFHGQP